MTLDELREWHTRRIGAKLKYEPDTGLYLLLDKNGIAFKEDPFPATLDAADASFPPGFEWQRNAKLWVLFRRFAEFATASVKDTGDKIRDMYELSKLAWEQEAAQ